MEPAESAAQSPFAIRTVAVIGAGEQGRALALRCARAGFRTILEDVMPAKLRRAGQELARLNDSAVASLLSFASSIEDAVREADLAIDFVPDELESKLEIFSLLDRMAPPKTVLCTPTLALSVTDLASCTYRADRCLALHASGEDLASTHLTMVCGRATKEYVKTAVADWLAALGICTEVIAEAVS